MRKHWNSVRLYFLGSKITADGDSSNETKRYLFLGIKAMTRLHIKKQRHYFANKGPSSQSYGFSGSHVWMWEWTIKKSPCWRFDTFELWCWRRLESPLDCKEIKPVNPKGNQSWMFIGRTDAEAGTPIFWPPDVKNWLIRKDPDAGKDWREEEKGTSEWDGWMTSPTRWTWVWASSGRWWRTENPGMLQSTALQRVGHKWATEQKQEKWPRASSETNIHWWLFVSSDQSLQWYGPWAGQLYGSLKTVSLLPIPTVVLNNHMFLKCQLAS